MTLTETIKAIVADIDPGTADLEVAWQVVASYATAAAYRQATFRLLVDEVRRVRRGMDRAIQMACFAATGSAAEQERAVGPADREDYLRTRVWVPRIGFLLVGQMTVEQHQARIEWLEGQRHSLSQDIAFHNDCVRRITEAGAACLDEVEMAVVA